MSYPAAFDGPGLFPRPLLPGGGGGGASGIPFLGRPGGGVGGSSLPRPGLSRPAGTASSSRPISQPAAARPSGWSPARTMEPFPGSRGFPYGESPEGFIPLTPYVPSVLPLPFPPEQFKDPTGRTEPPTRPSGLREPAKELSVPTVRGVVWRVHGYFRGLFGGFEGSLGGHYGGTASLSIEWRYDYPPYPFFNPDLWYSVWGCILNWGDVLGNSHPGDIGSEVTTLRGNQPAYGIESITCVLGCELLEEPVFRPLPLNETPPFRDAAPVAPPEAPPEAPPDSEPAPLIPEPFLPPGWEPYQPFPIPAFPGEPPLEEEPDAEPEEIPEEPPQTTPDEAPQQIPVPVVIPGPPIPAPEELPSTEPLPAPVPIPTPDPDPVPDPDPNPDPDPVPVPIPEPIPDPDPDPEPQPIPVPIPSPDPDPVPNPIPDPVPNPIPDPDPNPVPDPLPNPIPDPLPIPDPFPDPYPEPGPDPIPDPDPEPDNPDWPFEPPGPPIFPPPVISPPGEVPGEPWPTIIDNPQPGPPLPIPIPDPFIQNPDPMPTVFDPPVFIPSPPPGGGTSDPCKRPNADPCSTSISQKVSDLLRDIAIIDLLLRSKQCDICEAPCIQEILEKLDELLNRDDNGENPELEHVNLPYVDCDEDGGIQHMVTLQVLAGTLDSSDVDKFFQTSQYAMTHCVEERVSEKIIRLGTWLQLDRLLNILTFGATVHNATMLSRKLQTTLLPTLSQTLSDIGLKDDKGEALNADTVLGSTIENTLKTSVGNQNYTELTKPWKEANRIYQSVANLLSSIDSFRFSTIGALEIMGGWKARMTNALKTSGVLKESSYPWLNPSPSFDKQWSTSIQDPQNTSAPLDLISADVKTVAQVVSGIEAQKTNLLNSLEDGVEKPTAENKPQKTKATEAKTVSTSPDINEDDFIHPEGP